MLTKLYLLRHGETDWNQKSIFQGQTDIDLNQSGQNDARKAVEIFKDLKLNQIYSSDLKRAQNTAIMISEDKNMEIKVDKQLREISFGDWEGLKFKEIKDQFPKMIVDWQKDPLHYSPPAGENLIDFKKRIVNFFKKMIQKNKGDKILVVTHGGVIKVYLTAILSIDPKNFWQFQIDNGSLTEIKFYDEDIILSKLNFTNSVK